jgi:hypothetical protein
MNLSRQISVVRSVNDQVAGVGNVTGTHVDMQGYDGVLFLLAIGALTATQVTGLKAQMGTLANDTDQADIAGSQISVVYADANSNLLMVLDIYRPIMRYVRPVVLRSVANAVVDAVIAILYQPDRYGVGAASGLQALDATVKNLTVLASPPLGTA